MIPLLHADRPCCAGSKTVFLAIDAAVSALRQAEQLVSQVRRPELAAAAGESEGKIMLTAC